MGKHKYIQTPEKMWGLFEAYRNDVKKNPRIKVEYVGRNGERVETPIERPLSLDGFYCFGYDKGITIHHYFDNPEGAYDDYRGIITRIRKAVRSEQIDGAMVNAYNSNLTARLNGLTEKTESSVTVETPIFKGIDLDVPTDDSTKKDSRP
jgi:hypothetical protein